MIDNLKNFIINCLQEKKAKDVIFLDLENKTDLAKYMILATGSSKKNVSAIAQYIIDELKSKLSMHSISEGLNNSAWVLIDVGDIIVNVFNAEERVRIDLESKWQ
ncbi:MAG: ribosome silencing factor [Rickettsiaceae bacterium]